MRGNRGKRYGKEKTLNKKKLVSVILAFIVICMIIFSIKGLLSKEKDENGIGKKEYFAVYENNKWGVIDSSGNLVINPAYEEMIIVPDSTQEIFICLYNVNYQDGSYQTKVINSKEELLFTGYDLVLPIDNFDQNQNLWYEKSTLKVKKDNKYGLINYKGKEVLKCDYTNITALYGMENTLVLEKDGKYGIASNTGDVIIPAEYAEVKPVGKLYSDGYIVKNEARKYGVIGFHKNKVLDLEYDDIKQVIGNDMYVVKQQGNWKVINKAKEVILEGFDTVYSINGSHITIQKEGLYGVVGVDKKEEITPVYEALIYSAQDLFIAKRDGKYGILNSKGEEKVAFTYQNLIYRKDAGIYEGTKEGTNNTDLLDENLEVKLTGIISELNSEKGYFRVRTEGTYAYYNFKFEKKEAKDLLIGNTLFLDQKDGKYGFINKNGQEVVPYIYDDATEQNRFGYSAVKKDGKWGSINKDGKIVLEPEVDLENSFVINFIGKYHLAEELNLYYYTK